MCNARGCMCQLVPLSPLGLAPARSQIRRGRAATSLPAHSVRACAVDNTVCENNAGTRKSKAAYEFTSLPLERRVTIREFLNFSLQCLVTEGSINPRSKQQPRTELHHSVPPFSLGTAAAAQSLDWKRVQAAITQKTHFGNERVSRASSGTGGSRGRVGSGSTRGNRRLSSGAGECRLCQARMASLFMMTKVITLFRQVTIVGLPQTHTLAHSLTHTHARTHAHTHTHSHTHTHTHP